MKIFKFFKRKRFKGVTPYQNKFGTGFTLIEMMIVMLIAAILAAVAIPYFWGGYGSMEFKGSARRITSILRTAKSYAEAENVDYRVDFTVTGSQLDMVIIKDPDGAAIQVGKTEKLSLGSVFVIDISSLTGNSIRFTPEGTADDEDGTAADETITITNTKKSKSIDISILEDTGRVKISNIY